MPWSPALKFSAAKQRAQIISQTQFNVIQLRIFGTLIERCGFVVIATKESRKLAA